MTNNVNSLIEQARKELSNLTGLKASSIVRAVKDEKGWHVSIEMVEKESIPDGMDILATYEAIMDDEGNLLSFERKSMRKRIDLLVEEVE